MALFNFLPKEEQYFSMFTQMSSHIFDASRVLKEMLAADGGESYADYVKQLKSIEHSCDELTHSVSMRLNKSFITPFDREDIYLLSSALDDVVDLIDDAGRAMLMYDVRESTPEARQFADVIQRMAVQLHEIVSVLEKPTGIASRLVEVHRLENEGDDIYHAAIGKLFRETSDPLQVIKWKEIYETLETAVDRCEHVANIIESIIIKHA